MTGEHAASQIAASLTFPIAKLPQERSEMVATQTASHTVHQHAVRAVVATPTTTRRSRSVPRARSADRHSVRRADLADIPRIARLARATVHGRHEPENLSQARRLLLTHIAFEHGALWVERDEDGIERRAMAAVPAHPPAGDVGSPSRQVLTQILRGFQEAGRLLGPDGAVGFQEVLESKGTAWILCDIPTSTENREPSGEGLFCAALDWAEAHTDLRTDGLAVLTASPSRRHHAQVQGFVAQHVSHLDTPWWLGMRPAGVYDGTQQQLFADEGSLLLGDGL